MSFCACFCVLFLHPKQIFFFYFCNFMLSNPIIYRIIHGESGDMEFFYQSSTRYLSSELSHVETYIVKMVNLGKGIENYKK